MRPSTLLSAVIPQHLDQRLFDGMPFNLSDLGHRAAVLIVGVQHLECRLRRRADGESGNALRLVAGYLRKSHARGWCGARGGAGLTVVRAVWLAVVRRVAGRGVAGDAC